MNKVLLLLALSTGVVSQSICAKTVTDELLVGNAKFSSGSSYKNFTLSGGSGAEYAGNALSGNTSAWQFNATTTGIWVTKAPENAKLVSISYTPTSSANAKSVVSIFGSTEAYTSKPTKTSLTTITPKNLTVGTEQTYTFSDTYSACGFVSTTAGVSYWSSIKVTWDISDDDSSDSNNSGDTDNSGSEGDNNGDNGNGDNNGDNSTETPGTPDNNGNGDNNSTETPSTPDTDDTVTEAVRFHMISSADELIAGKKYLLVASSSSKTLSTTSSSSAISPTSVTLSSDKSLLTNPADDALILTLGGQTGSWTWTAADGKALYTSKSSNNLTLSSESVAKFAVSFTKSIAKIAVGSDNQILYSSATNAFKHYSQKNSGKSGYQDIQIYVLEEKPSTPAFEFGEIVAADQSTYTIPYGSTVKVSSENASSLKVAVNALNADESFVKEFDQADAELTFTVPGEYTVTGKNESGSAETKCNILVAKPLTPTISADNMVIDGQTATLPLGTEVTVSSRYAQYIIVNDDKENPKENPYKFTFDGDTELSFSGIAKTEVSEALALSFKAQTFSVVAPTATINGEAIDATAVNSVWNYQPIVLTAEGADYIRVQGSDVDTKIKTDSSWNSKFYAASSDEYSFSAIFGDVESDAVKYDIEVKTPAAPAVTSAGSEVANESKLYVPANNPATVKVVAEGAKAITLTQGESMKKFTGAEAFITIDKAGAYSVNGVYGDNDATSEVLSFTAVASNKVEKYSLVTDESQLVEGRSYVIAYQNIAMSNQPVSSSVKMLGTANVNISNNVLASNSAEVAVVTLVKSDASWKLMTYNAGADKGLVVTDDKNLAIDENASEFNIVINNDEAFISLTTNADRAIRYNYNNGNAPRYGYYNDGQSNVKLYALQPLSDTAEFADFASFDTVSDQDQSYYTGSMTVVFAYGNEMWLTEDNSDVAIRAILSEDVDTELVAGDKIQGVVLNKYDGVNADNYHVVNIAAAPDYVTASTAEAILEPTVIARGEEVTASQLGHYVAAYAYFNANGSFAQPNTIVLYGENEATYTLVNHFSQLGANTESEDEDTAIQNWEWNALTNGWIDSTDDAPEADAEVTVMGFADLVDGQYVIYPLTMTAPMLSTGVNEIANDNATAIVNGDTVLLPQGAALYNLNGVRVSPAGLAPGVYVVRYADNTAAKLHIR